MAVQDRKLGKNLRLFIGNTALPVSDTTYTAVINENEIEVSYKADVEEISTKEAGKLSFPGDESFEMKFEAAEVFTDPGFVLVEGAKNTPWKFQIRDVSGTDTVWLEGEFIVSDMEYKAGTQGVRTVSVTLKNSNTVTLNRPSRALTV